MVKRMVKFPLKMKNGAEVRSLDELRANSDVESVMQYYFSGQLARWCKAFDITEISDNFKEKNISFVENVLNTLGVDLSHDDIECYVDNNFGHSEKVDIVPDTSEEKIIDNQAVKTELGAIIDKNINLNDYQIELAAIKDDEGNIKKYRVCITNDKIDQYRRFSIPYVINDEYSDLAFKKDLLKKIKYTIEEADNSVHLYVHKTSDISLLSVGDVFEFGTFNNKHIKWRVLKKNDNNIFVISESKVFNHRYHCNQRYRSSEWDRCDLNYWLNEIFVNYAFSEEEKKVICKLSRWEYLTILTKEEAAGLMNESERSIGEKWCLRSMCEEESNPLEDDEWIWRVNPDGTFDYSALFNDFAIRPAMYLTY